MAYEQSESHSEGYLLTLEMIGEISVLPLTILEGMAEEVLEGFSNG